MQRSALVSRRTPQRARTRVGWTLLHRCAAGVGWDLVRMNQRTSFARSKRWCTSWKGGVVLTRPLTATFSSVVKKEIQHFETDAMSANCRLVVNFSKLKSKEAKLSA